MNKFLILIILTTLLGCVENIKENIYDHGTIKKVEKVRVQPVFQLAGVDKIPNSLVVKKMGLTISELRFAPMDSKDIAFTTLEPLHIRFDLLKNETRKVMPTIELPKAGRYLVSVRLEPVTTGESRQSFFMEGIVEEESDVETKGSGRPQPLLVDEVKDLAPEGWTAFRYQSKRTVFFTLNDIYLEEGQQSLAFEFDASKWSGSVLHSISKAVRSSELSNKEGVDVTSIVESSGDDFTGLIETGIVENRSR